MKGEKAPEPRVPSGHTKGFGFYSQMGNIRKVLRRVTASCSKTIISTFVKATLQGSKGEQRGQLGWIGDTWG